MTAGMDDVHAALAAGDLGTVRNCILSLRDDDRRLLEEELGSACLRRLEKTARRGRSGKLGRVIVINGIMGALLDSVKDDDADRVWINLWRLMWGRIGDFELRPDGTPVDREIHVQVAGLHKTYLPMLLELDSRWDVCPFAFDWRHDIDASAVRLAQCVRDWAQGEPVHLMAHSMGGVVSRRMIQRFPEVWSGMDDAGGHRRGGRLVMLGTPNRGSYIIPLMLSGEEKMVRMLAALDVTNKLQKVLEIIATFPGSYQMLPSPLASEVPDDHERLFDRSAWGALPVRPKLLEMGRAFQTELDPVIDPGRLIYVAGYDQRTPSRIRIESGGAFRYQYTMDGDGRVPHELGLLDGVRTFWVAESHGDLPKNECILDGVHMLLRSGVTDTLEASRPARRGVAEPGAWLTGQEIEPLPPEFNELRPTRRRKRPPVRGVEEARLETLIYGDYLGRPATRADGARGGPVHRTRRRRGGRIDLRIEVVWGNIQQVPGDVYCVGHYQNVLPQNAEYALDCVVSGPDADTHEMVLTDLTRRGVLVGRLGDVNFYPWSKDWPGRRDRLVAVAGMGRHGVFDGYALVQLARNLASAVSKLPDAKTVCTVLIGSGEGALTVYQALRGMMLGLAEALADERMSSIRTLRIVEYKLHRAHEIVQKLHELREQEPDLELSHLPRKVREGRGGDVDTSHGLALTLAAAADAVHMRAGSATRGHAEALLRRIPASRRPKAKEALRKLGEVRDVGIGPFAGRLRVQLDEEDQRPVVQPTRISYAFDDGAIRMAAITNSATVPQRVLSGDFDLVRELTELCVDPYSEDAEGLADRLEMVTVHEDFTDLFRRDTTLVFEVDREMATVPWEMLPGDRRSPHRFVATQRPVARQLRTTYSPPPMASRGDGAELRALVIGDPGDPDEGDHLPGARREARAVAAILRTCGCEVTELIGAPTRTGRGPFPDVPPASRLDALYHLNRGEYDLVHYCGHGDFDPDDPGRVGWIFKGGLITPAEIQQMQRAPRLIVANACLSGRTAATPAGRRGSDRERGLLPSLADEFFRQGVHNYIGTAWEINDAGAVLFARTLYRRLFSRGGQPPAPLGDALLEARRKLYDQQKRFECLWAAYQLYGDPQLEL